MDIRIDGRIVLVTGDAQGVGEAIALEAARSGAAGVIITDRNAEAAQSVLKRLTEIGTDATFVAADLTDPAAPETIFAAALARFGRVDALVNAAGLTDRASLLDADLQAWETLFAVNARAPFFLMQKFVAHLKEGKSPGAIVNIASLNAHLGAPDLAVYSATKAALSLLTRNTANAHRFDRIRANGINLGWADTPGERRMQAITLGHGDAWIEKAAAGAPFGRLVVPEDVARLTTFLLSDASVPMTGAVIDQDQWVLGARD